MDRWVPVRDAAIALGVSEATLKRHIKTGKVTGRQEPYEKGWRWLVELSDEQLTSQTKATSGHKAGNEELVEELREQNRRLWEEVESNRREVAELHVLLQRAQQATPQLPPVVDLTPATPERTSATTLVSPLTPQQEATPKKGFLKRLFGTA